MCLKGLAFSERKGEGGQGLGGEKRIECGQDVIIYERRINNKRKQTKS